MSSLDLASFASRIVQGSGAWGMLPVVEKELLHYEILEALDHARLLDNLVFQGGTCLRLCYGAVRYSEDLDFAGGSHFDFASISAIKEVLEKALPERYGIESTVVEGDERPDASIPASKLDQTLGRDIYREVMAQRLQELYWSVIG